MERATIRSALLFTLMLQQTQSRSWSPISGGQMTTWVHMWTATQLIQCCSVVACNCVLVHQQ